MSLFCLLWIPLFYLFWRCVTGENSAAGGVWALIIGSIAAMLQFFLGHIVEPGGFGFSRWLSGFIDIVALPALTPILLYFLFVVLGLIRGNIDFTNFALLWLIPGGAINAVSWSAKNDPILLVLVPLLWTAIAVGIPFFIRIIQSSHWAVIILASLGIIIIPLAAATSYWAFFSQQFLLGLLFYFVASAPMKVSMVLSFIRARGNG